MTADQTRFSRESTARRDRSTRKNANSKKPEGDRKPMNICTKKPPKFKVSEWEIPV